MKSTARMVILMAATLLSPFVNSSFAEATNDVVSHLISYQFHESMADLPDHPNIASPLVSYIYYEWPGDSNLTFESSARVSYGFEGPPLGALTVDGPSNVTAGSVTPFASVVSSPGWGSIDISYLCDWELVGENAGGSHMLGCQLNAGYPSAASTVQIRASYTRPEGRVTSDPFMVTIAQGMVVQIEDPTVQSDGAAWVLSVQSKVTGGSGALAYEWFFDEVAIEGEYSGSLSLVSVTGMAGSRLLRLAVTDDEGTAHSSLWVTFNRPSVPGEPPVGYPAVDMAEGNMLSQNGGAFAFDPSRSSNGLIVITHGLWSEGNTPWLTSTASAIEERLADEGRPLPSIAIYDWQDGSDASTYAGIDNWTDWRWWVDAASLGLSGFLTDIVVIKPIAEQRGVELANWVYENIGRGYISSSSPIHLIGHSAGGFVVGECATVLKQPGVGIHIDRVTMLDTPIPTREHFTVYPDPGTVERYSSSGLGAFDPTLLGVSPGSYYQYSVVPQSWVYGGLNHSYAHEWYRDDTITWTYEDGFHHSPFLNGPVVDRDSIKGSQVRTADSGVLVEHPLVGFGTFGSVSFVEGTYTLTEAANAGIHGDFNLPIGAQALRFRYQFTSPGDGDYLSVHWGEQPPILVASDLPLSRENSVEAETDIGFFLGETNTLIFTLISRGATNAVVQIEDVRLVVSDDPDSDGLTTTEESIQGTDPLKQDTDDDGLSDYYELFNAGTDPLDPDSDGDGSNDGDELAAGTCATSITDCLRISGIVVNTNGARVSWDSIAGKSYSLNRAASVADVGWNYSVLTNVSATPATNHFLDGGIGDEQSAFYWIELSE